MKALVTELGVLIPRELLEGVKEVEIQKEDNKISVTPVSMDDPIFRLGKHPVSCGVSDASSKHDKYIYGHTS